MKQCPACRSFNVRRSGFTNGKAKSKSFQSPYRCNACDTSFWVVSRTTRIVGITGIAASAFIVLVGILSTTPPAGKRIEGKDHHSAGRRSVSYPWIGVRPARADPRGIRKTVPLVNLDVIARRSHR